MTEHLPTLQKRLAMAKIEIAYNRLSMGIAALSSLAKATQPIRRDPDFKPGGVPAPHHNFNPCPYVRS